jgi:hypothetical protein
VVRVVAQYQLVAVGVWVAVALVVYCLDLV